MEQLSTTHSSLSSEKLHYGLFFGLIAGFVFSFFTWGIDAIQLATNHGMLPWAKFVIGGIPTMLLGSLAGWLGYRFNHMFSSFIIWLATGLAFSWISAYLPFRIFQNVVALLNPDIAKVIDYPVISGTYARAFIIFVAVTGITTIAGLLHTTLAEGASTGIAPLPRILPVVFWIFLFYLASLAPQSNTYEELRNPVVAINQLIQFAEDNQGKTIDPQTIRDIHYGAVRGILDKINEPRQLILSSYDDTISATQVIVKFTDAWASCYLINSHPSNCKFVTYDELLPQ